LSHFAIDFLACIGKQAFFILSFRIRKNKK